jgi:HEAT repeats/HEAT repeat
MRKPIRIALAVLLGSIVGVIAWQVLRGPVYQGKTLSSWILQHAKSSAPPNQDRAAQESAEIAICRIGTNGLPTLLAWAGMRDSWFRKKMLTLMSDEVRWKSRVLSANDYHAGASYGFGVLKSIAKPAVPSLIKLLNDSDPNIRSGAAFCLCQIGPAAAEAVPALLQSLDDPEAQSNAFAALRSIGVKPDVLVPVLIGYLSSTNMGQRGWVVSPLSELGTDAQAAVPKLLESLDSPEAGLRRAATNLLRKIDPDAAAKAGVK